MLISGHIYFSKESLLSNIFVKMLIMEELEWSDLEDLKFSYNRIKTKAYINVKLLKNSECREQTLNLNLYFEKHRL
ncbi:hypothetical protein SAMN05880574_105132 [Chryseobacterium sp. RU37D]|nr:hypothetical protein SAMN05880574_105132 [Chryseobacterium sp. RU37D]